LLSMLPGFRFLCAAIVLSMSILIFGLGAAALLRVALEEFSSTPFWRAAPETVFAPQREVTKQGEATRPVLATLRVDPLPAEEKVSDDLSAVAAPAELAPATESVLAEPEQMAALKAEDSLPPEPATPEIPVSEILPQSEAAPAEADGSTSAAADETKIAASEQVSPPPNEAAPAASDQTSLPALPEADIIGMKIAALGDPTIALEATPPAKAASTKPDQSEIKKRLQARRAAERRRMAARARAAQQAAQQFADPFSQLAAQPAAVARSR
jgi:hypothetical protein